MIVLGLIKLKCRKSFETDLHNIKYNVNQNFQLPEAYVRYVNNCAAGITRLTARDFQMAGWRTFGPGLPRSSSPACGNHVFYYQLWHEVSCMICTCLHIWKLLDNFYS